MSEIISLHKTRVRRVRHSVKQRTRLEAELALARAVHTCEILQRDLKVVLACKPGDNGFPTGNRNTAIAHGFWRIAML